MDLWSLSNHIVKSLVIISPGGNVAESYKQGGGQVRTWNLIEQLSDKGWKITVIEAPGDGCDMAESTAFKHILPPRLSDFNPYLYFTLFQCLRQKQVDVIHVKGYSGVLAAYFVTLLFESILISYDAQNFETSKVTEDIHHIPLYKRPIALILVPPLEYLSTLAANVIITVSEDDRKNFINSLRVNPEKIVTIPSGSKIVSCENIDDMNNIDSNNNIILGFHGTYDYYPNREAINIIEDKLVPQLSDKGLNFEFIIAGEGMPNFEKIDYIKSFGFVENLESFLCSVDIAVIPLIHGGGTKLKVLDYLCSGVPVITTRIGAEGIKITDGKEAIIHDNVNDSFINSILSLSADSTRRYEIGENGKTIANKYYTWEKVGQTFDRIYTNEL